MATKRRRPKAQGRKSILSVHGSEQLQAAVLAVRAADKDLRRDLNARARAVMGPEWVKGLESRLVHPAQRVVTAGARVAAGNPPQLVAGNSKRKIGRGLIPVQHWAGFEYGAARYRSYYGRVSPRGRKHWLKRDTRAHLPARTKHGHIIGPAVRNIIPRLAALWVQTVIRTYLDAIEGKQ